MSDIIREFERYMGGAVTEPPRFDPARCAHAFAMKYGLREKLTYKQAQALERALTTHLRAWMKDPS